MPETEAVTIHILDKEWRVACPPEERDQLLEAARELDAKARFVKDQGRIVGSERIALQAGLMIASELVTERAEHARQRHLLQGRAAALTEQLDAVLDEVGDPEGEPASGPAASSTDG